MAKGRRGGRLRGCKERRREGEEGDVVVEEGGTRREGYFWMKIKVKHGGIGECGLTITSIVGSWCTGGAYAATTADEEGEREREA